MGPDDSHQSLLKSVSSLPNIVSFLGQRSIRPSYQAHDEDRIKILASHNEDHWNGYKEFLLQNYNVQTAKVRLSYSKKYCHVLVSGAAQELLVLSNDKRIHIMKALAALSKYLGSYDRWKEIIEKHQLKWSNEYGLKAFNDILMNNGNNYNSMVRWLKEATSKLPVQYGNILLFDALAGLRPDEACKSIILLKEKGQKGYLNMDTMALEHFRYPEIFIRKTKKAYISVLTEKSLNQLKDSATCGYNALRLAVKRYNLSMNMAFSRKIFATHLLTNGIERETIDLLQGRAPRSIFARHYFRPDLDYERIKVLLDKLHDYIVT